MTRKSLSKRILMLIGGIFFFHFAASFFHWYSSIWYFDMPMHFMGGLFLGLSFFWILWPQTLTTSLILKILMGVLIVGVGWEVFELIFVNVVAQNYFKTFDTFSDICFDMAGGLTALLYVFRKTSRIIQTTL